MSPVTVPVDVLKDMAQHYALEAANSNIPSFVLLQYLKKAFALGADAGHQVGLTESSEALDVLAAESYAGGGDA